MFPSEEEQKQRIAEAEDLKPSAFVVSSEDIDTILLRGSGIENGKSRIYEQFSKQEGRESNIAFLKKEYGIGGIYPIIAEKRIDESHDAKGIQLSSSDGKLLLSWSSVEKRIGELIAEGRYQAEAEFLGERGNALYFYAPVSFGRETEFGDVPKLRDDQRVVIVSPVCYHTDEFLQEHHITFLKLGRDIEADALIGKMPEEQIAAMQRAESALIDRFERELPNGQKVLNFEDVFPYSASAEERAEMPKIEHKGAFGSMFNAIKNSDTLPMLNYVATEAEEDEMFRFNVEKGNWSQAEADYLREKLHERRSALTKKEMPKEVAPNNYRITNERIGIGTPLERYTQNTAAIRLLHQLEYENRLATPDE